MTPPPTPSWRPLAVVVAGVGGAVDDNAHDSGDDANDDAAHDGGDEEVLGRSRRAASALQVTPRLRVLQNNPARRVKAVVFFWRFHAGRRMQTIWEQFSTRNCAGLFWFADEKQRRNQNIDLQPSPDFAHQVQSEQKHFLPCPCPQSLKSPPPPIHPLI